MINRSGVNEQNVYAYNLRSLPVFSCSKFHWALVLAALYWDTECLDRSARMFFEKCQNVSTANFSMRISCVVICFVAVRAFMQKWLKNGEHHGIDAWSLSTKLRSQCIDRESTVTTNGLCIENTSAFVFNYTRRRRLQKVSFFFMFGAEEGRRHDFKLPRKRGRNDILAQTRFIGDGCYYIYPDAAYIVRIWMKWHDLRVLCSHKKRYLPLKQMLFR